MTVPAGPIEWTSVRGLGNSISARISLIMPFIGYLIIFNAHISALLTNLVPINSGLSDPPDLMSNLYLTYFGLLFFSVASCIYQIFCDKVVKAYPDHRAYILHERNNMFPEEMKEICNIVLKNNPDIDDGGKLKSILSLIQGGSSINDELKAYILYCDFKDKNLKLQFMAYATALFYLIGLFLLAIPPSLISFKVAELLWSKL